MEAVTTLPRSRPLTRADLEAMPDDGHRYELIDGALIVTPAPSLSHQRVLAALYRLLHHACPAELEVLFAPFDVALADDTLVEPDLLVARRCDLTERELPTAPVLAVEVLSPSTRRIDLTLKRDRYREAGCASYWVIDPAGPEVTAWELRGGEYVLVTRAAGTARCEVRSPFALSFTPAQLAD
jgi:Uma2 family endonuclease